MMNLMRKVASLTNMFEEAIEEYSKVYEQVYYEEVYGLVEEYGLTKEEEEWLDSVDPVTVLNNNQKWIEASDEEKNLAMALYVRRIMRKHELKKMHYEKKYKRDYYVVAVGYSNFFKDQGQMVKAGEEILKKMFPNSWICY